MSQVVIISYHLHLDRTGNWYADSCLTWWYSRSWMQSTQRAISTGGFGGRGLQVPGADPLFSQGVIETSPLGILAVANVRIHWVVPGWWLLMARQPGSDTISVFSISENDPSSLAPLGTPVWSRGEFPVSVAFNKAGDVLCALNTINCWSLLSKASTRQLTRVILRSGTFMITSLFLKISTGSLCRQAQITHIRLQ